MAKSFRTINTNDTVSVTTINDIWTNYIVPTLMTELDVIGVLISRVLFAILFDLLIANIGEVYVRNYRLLVELNSRKLWFLVVQ